MKRNLVKWTVVGAALVVLAGCGSTPAMQPQKSLISAAQFDAMITIEVRELEPLPVEHAVAAN